MSALRSKISRSQVDGSVCTTRFYTASDNFADPQNLRIRTDTATLSPRIRDALASTAVSVLTKQSYQGIEGLTVEMAYERATAFIASLLDDTWSPGRTASEAPPSDLEQAVFRVMQDAGLPRSLDEIRETFEGLTAVGKRDLHKNPLIARAVAEIKAAKAKDALAAAKKAKGDGQAVLDLFAKAAE